MPKQEARTFSAASNVQGTFNPATASDKCFLCSNTVGETDPRGFYCPNNNPNQMFLCHRQCLDRLAAVGGNPADFHLGAAAPPPPEESSGPSNIQFTSFEEMQSYIQSKGPIPDGVEVWVGTARLR